MPNRLIFAGLDSGDCAYVMIYDRLKSKPSVVYIFDETKGRISYIRYGPYDNGHVNVGFESGAIAILDSIHL